MIYLKNFQDKIYKNSVLTALEKLAILKQIVDKEVQKIVSDVEANFEGYSEAADVDELKDHKIREDIHNTCTTGNQIRTYFAATGDAAMKKKRVEHII